MSFYSFGIGKDSSGDFKPFWGTLVGLSMFTGVKPPQISCFQGCFSVLSWLSS